MADTKLQRITIGFQGQALAVRVDADALASLRKALEKGAERWHELEAEDGALLLDLGKIEFVRLDTGDQRVGFGA
jgi:hypothetical protein